MPTPEISPEPSPVPTPTIQPSVAPSPTLSPEPVITPSSTPQVTPLPDSTPSASPIVSPSPSPAPTPELVWQSLGDRFETINNVITGKEYTAEQNNKVKVKFTVLPELSGKLAIKEVKLTEEQIKQTAALSDTAYEITSTMVDGTFFYDLTLPIPVGSENKQLEVKSSETTDQIKDAQKITEPKEKTADTVTIYGLNHFTVFILTAPSPDNTQSILVNEILPNPSTGNEWVELYNNTDANIDLGAGWTIKNSIGTSESLASLGNISPRGLKVFEHIPGWLNDSSPEAITISDNNGIVVDIINISSGAPGIEVDHYPNIDESVGRLPDGSANWVIFTSPTKGSMNVTPNARAVSPTNNADNNFPDWYQDDNGVRVVQDPTLPALLSGSFPEEFFYWSAEALMGTPGGGARLTLAAEAAFANGPVVPGDQITFGRIRIRADGLTPNTDYTVTHPFGSVVIRTDNTGELRSGNDDIGCAGNPCNFADALNSPVFQSFLRWDKNAPAGFLGDGITGHTVTGSPNGNNFFRIEGPGLPDGKIDTNLFIVLGKLMIETPPPPPGCEDIAPEKPVLVSPADNATEVTNSPTLTWNAVANFGNNCLGNNNQFEIFLDSGNANPTTSWGSVSETTLTKQIIGLSGNTTYSWKVRAKNGALFTDSDVQTFTTVVAAGGSRAVSTAFREDGYPKWYRDDNGITVEPCLDGSDPFCAPLLPPFGEEPQWDPNQPTVFPTNFPSEFFYWTAEAAIEQAGVNALLILADEGAFLNELPAPGDQMVFGRIRVRASGLLPNQEYIITHPYGQNTYTTNEFGDLRPSPNTEDIGCFTPLCDFSLALNSRIFGGFLRQPSAPDGYLGDGVTAGPVIGSPEGTNFFKIEGPGLPEGGIQTSLFTVVGKMHVDTPPPPGCEDTAPQTPNLISPANGATNISTNPALSWEEVTDFGTNCAGGRNQFEIFMDQGNVDPTTSKGTVLGTQTSFTVLNLLPNTLYSWKVRASNNALFSDSEIRTFTTSSSPVSRAVSIINDADNGFPEWYRDELGVSVAPCLNGTDANCVLPGPGEEPNFDPNQPTDFPDNFPTEFFYFLADSERIDTPGGGNFSMRFAAEGAFLAEVPTPSDQMVFGRIRANGDGLQPNSTYTVTHPYGVDVYQTDNGGVLTSVAATEDIGCGTGPCDFTLALNSRVFGGFLKWEEGAPAGYLGDVAVPHIVIGAPTGNNFVRIEGPGLPPGGLETNLFTVSGKLFISEAQVLTSVTVVPSSATIDVGATQQLTANPLDQNNAPFAGATITWLSSDTNVATVSDTGLVTGVGAGIATITATATDGTNTVTGTSTLTVNEIIPPLDLVPPVITILGSNPIDVAVGVAYSDQGATAVDNVDGDITANIVTTGLPIDTSAPGVFTVTYTVSDIALNIATAQRTVNVVAAPLTTGTITVLEDSVPDDVQDFGFRLRDGGFDQSFSLDDDGDNLNGLTSLRVFADLNPGTYSLQQTSLGNFVLDNLVCQDPDNGTTVDLGSRTATVGLLAGENITCTFTNSLRQSVSGMKFNDANGNGTKDTGEFGLPGWTIYLDTNDDGTLNNGEVSAFTDASGNYQFTNLGGGTYNIREVLQEGWVQTAPVTGKYALTVNSNSSFINQDFGNIASYTTPGGDVGYIGDITSTPGIVALDPLVFTAPSGEGFSTVSVPEGTVITPVAGGNIDATKLTISTPSADSLSGLTEGTVVGGVLQWGIADLGLQFTSPITLSIYVGTALNGQTLDVLRSITPLGPWVNDGIIAPATCLVSGGICSFQATKASYYLAREVETSEPTPTPAPTDTGTSGSGSSGSGGGGSANAPTCNDAPAGSAPILLSAVVSGPNEVTLTWSKAQNPVTHYVVSYGLSAGSPLYGNPNVGGKDTTSYTVKELSGGTTYYFRVRAGNGCNGGEYSNELSATPGGVVISGPAAGFSEGVLGVETTGEGALRASEGITESTPSSGTSETLGSQQVGELSTTGPVLKDNKRYIIAAILALLVLLPLVVKYRKKFKF